MTLAAAPLFPASLGVRVMGDNRTVILAAAVALVVGLVFGAFGGPLVLEDDPAPSPRPVAALERPERPSRPDNRPSRPEPVAPRPSDDNGNTPVVPNRPPPITEAGPSVPSSLGNHLATALTKPIERLTGNGQITGKVMLEGEMTGIAGVLVEADGFFKQEGPRPSPHRAPSNANPRVIPNLEQAALNIVDSQHTIFSRYYYTHTDAEGNYTLSGLPETMHFNLSARGVGIQASACDEGGNKDSSASRDVASGSSVYFVAEQRWEPEIEVLMPDGSHAQGAVLKYGTWPALADDVRPEDLVDSVSMRRSTPVPAPGSVANFGSGDYVVRAELEDPDRGIGRLESPPVRVTTNLGPSPKITLQLQEVPSILVRVTGKNNDTVRVACIEWSGETPTPASLRNNSNWLRLSNGKNAHVYSDIKPGRFLVFLLDSASRTIHEQRDVTLGASSQVVDFVVPEAQRSDYLVVWVQAPNGELLDGASVRAGYTSGNRVRYGSSNNSERQTDGSYRTPHPNAPENATNVTYMVSASHSDYGEVFAEYNIGPASVATLRFLPAARLTVNIDGGSSAAPDVTVRWSYKTSTGGSSSTNAIRMGNVHRLGPIQPTTVTVYLQLNSGQGSFGGWGGSSGVQIDQQELDLKSGENTLRMSLPRMHTLTVRAPGASSGVSIYATMRQDSEGNRPRYYSRTSAEVGADGTAVFELPYGTYSISLGGYSGLSATLPQDSFVTLTKR